MWDILTDFAVGLTSVKILSVLVILSSECGQLPCKFHSVNFYFGAICENFAHKTFPLYGNMVLSVKKLNILWVDYGCTDILL